MNGVTLEATTMQWATVQIMVSGIRYFVVLVVAANCSALLYGDWVWGRGVMWNVFGGVGYVKWVWGGGYCGLGLVVWGRDKHKNESGFLMKGGGAAYLSLSDT